MVKKCNEPRSYIVETERGNFRRNRFHLIEAPLYESKNIQDNPISDLINSHNLNNNNNFDCNKNVTANISDENVTVNVDENNINVNNSSDEVLSENLNKNSSSVETKEKRISRKPAWLKDFATA